MRNLLPILLFLFFFGCEKHTRIIPLGHEFDLGFMQEKVLEGTTIPVMFTQVTDNRCPENTRCETIFPFAVITLDIGNESFELSTQEGKQTTFFQNLEVTLLSLHPVPKVSMEYPPEAYKATLLFTEQN